VTGAPANCFPATALTGATQWQTAVVREIDRPTDRLVLLRLEVPDRIMHLAGQHYVVRLTADVLRPLADGAELGYVCGSARFAEAVSVALTDTGLGADRIRVERFGPTG